MTAPTSHAGGDWQRLDARMIWVDAAQTALSLIPALLAVTVFGVEPSLGALWPMLLLALWGVVGAAADALRWLKTRYRITDEYVERRTGLLVRKYRSIRRERIRSVDTTARLRHRLAGLRLVTIGAGQQNAAGESALSLDAVSHRVAEALRHELLGQSAHPARASEHPEAGDAVTTPLASPPAESELARIRWSWIFYNLFNSWAYLAAAGLLWGANWLASGFGLDLAGFLVNLLDWQRLGWGWSLLIGLVGVGAFGVLVLAVSFVTEYWQFRLTRTAGEQGTVLRTTQGLLKIRQVDRDERRLRGVEISEPVLWRWMGLADTNVITTGLATWSLTPASTILPRGPIRVARPVAAAVLRVARNPLATQLRRHPAAALRRRIWWAVGLAGVLTGALWWASAAITAAPAWLPVAGLGLLPVMMLAAVIAYRALGHALVDDYLVVRSGLVARATAALQSRAVVGWQIRQSALQRRLGLATLVATTAAGAGSYRAPDLDTVAAVALADRAVPGLLAPFLIPAAPATESHATDLEHAHD